MGPVLAEALARPTSAKPPSPPLPLSAAAVQRGGAGRRRELRLRVFSALVLVPAVVACVLAGGLAWAGLVGLAGGLLAWEWARLRGPDDRRAIASVLTVLAVGVLALDRQVMVALAVTGAAALYSLLARAHRPLRFGVPYIALTAISLISLRATPQAGAWNVLFVLVCVWASDIGAFFAGRHFGGALLAVSISPAKTWSGALGGLGAAAAAGVGLAAIAGAVAAHAHPEAADARTALADALRALPLALSLGAASEAGDLFESWIKRQVGAKHSGGLIPGHGGVLDRLDGLLAAAPLAGAWAACGAQGAYLWQ